MQGPITAKELRWLRDLTGRKYVPFIACSSSGIFKSFREDETRDTSVDQIDINLAQHLQRKYGTLEEIWDNNDILDIISHKYILTNRFPDISEILITNYLISVLDEQLLNTENQLAIIICHCEGCSLFKYWDDGGTFYDIVNKCKENRNLIQKIMEWFRPRIEQVLRSELKKANHFHELERFMLEL